MYCIGELVGYFGFIVYAKMAMIDDVVNGVADYVFMMGIFCFLVFGVN